MKMSSDKKELKDAYYRISKKFKSMVIKKNIPYSATTILIIMAYMMEDNSREEVIEMFDDYYDEIKKLKDEYDDFMRDD